MRNPPGNGIVSNPFHLNVIARSNEKFLNIIRRLFLASGISPGCYCIIVTKPDKSNGVVILNKDCCVVGKMKVILDDKVSFMH